MTEVFIEGTAPDDGVPGCTAEPRPVRQWNGSSLESVLVDSLV